MRINYQSIEFFRRLLRTQLIFTGKACVQSCIYCIIIFNQRSVVYYVLYEDFNLKKVKIVVLYLRTA